MHDTKVSDALRVLTVEDPSYEELVSLYNELRQTTSFDHESTVSRRALAQVVGELVDYVDFVGDELEKCWGIRRAAERERVLAAFDEPRGATSVERVSRFVGQWESIERYSREDVAPSVEH